MHYEWLQVSPMKRIGIFESSLRIGLAARLTTNVAQTEACRCPNEPRGALVQTQNRRTKN